MKGRLFISAFVLCTSWASAAAADTSLEILHGWNYNNDFNGAKERTIYTVKTFQPWQYGTFFLYYDITGPFTPPDSKVLPNEKGGFFGGQSFTLSAKRIGEKISGEKWDWGALGDVSLRYEMEHVSKFGMLMYYGLQWDLKIPGFDFVAATTVIRDDWSLKGVDLQIGGAWQMTIPLGNITDFVFAGFVQWGMFGEGSGAIEFCDDGVDKCVHVQQKGAPFVTSQPQFLLDVGKLARITDRHFYAGIEYQIALNRYLQKGVNENLAQVMFKWAL
ncbi:hypothetical protein LZC95_24760 [Pendulispora brunnea]|uniref:Uncharacterized protein n=1 Tax=Pendulispora brunnea TaxID=2905690 RepID=A0ABZ2KRT3_9BACT